MAPTTVEQKLVTFAKVHGFMYAFFMLGFAIALAPWWAPSDNTWKTPEISLQICVESLTTGSDQKNPLEWTVFVLWTLNTILTFVGLVKEHPKCVTLANLLYVVIICVVEIALIMRWSKCHSVITTVMIVFFAVFSLYGVYVLHIVSVVLADIQKKRRAVILITTMVWNGQSSQQSAGQTPAAAPVTADAAAAAAAPNSDAPAMEQQSKEFPTWN